MAFVFLSVLPLMAFGASEKLAYLVVQLQKSVDSDNPEDSEDPDNNVDSDNPEDSEDPDNNVDSDNPDNPEDSEDSDNTVDSEDSGNTDDSEDADDTEDIEDTDDTQESDELEKSGDEPFEDLEFYTLSDPSYPEENGLLKFIITDSFVIDCKDSTMLEFRDKTFSETYPLSDIKSIGFLIDELTYAEETLGESQLHGWTIYNMDGLPVDSGVGTNPPLSQLEAGKIYVIIENGKRYKYIRLR